MASYGVVSPPSVQNAQFNGGYPSAPPAQYQQNPVRPGTLPPGTCIKIGDYEVTIERFLSEGGFAHVYLVRSSQPIPSPAGSSETYHVLKRVAAADKPVLREIRWEVDVMKLLRGHKYIVNLIEASASIIPGTTGYEVFILMEYCSGGGIIDFMNTRLQNRLTEQEILKIFSDVVEGVCWMHTRDPPLMHRDLKVENILLAGPNFYKLCDFGSTAVPKPKPAQTMQEIQELEMDLNKHTTIQYRAPEMCDVWSRKLVGLPSDIWALGVLLYKLCFYTTPFEEQGPLAILNVQYKMPSYPNYSADIRSLIASMLVESISQRPTALQVHKEVCRLRGVAPTSSYQPSPSQRLLSAGQAPGTVGGSVSPALPNLPISRPASGLSSVLDVQGSQQASSAVREIDTSGVAPMRRGRPGKAPGAASSGPSKLQPEWAAPNNGALETAAGGMAYGFNDSFSPPTVSQSVPPLSHALEPVAEPVKPSKTALATAALFEELSSPGSTAKAPPTLASLAAARSGQTVPVPAKPIGMGLPVSLQQENGLRRVSPGKPLGPRSLSNASQPGGSNQPKSPPVAAKPGFLGLQLQQETTEISPRDSYTVARKDAIEKSAETERRPSFVNRASQTSPTLLSNWMQDQQRSPNLTQEAATTSATPAPADQSDSMSKFPSLADWEGQVSPGLEAEARSPSFPAPAPALQRTASSISTSGAAERPSKVPSFDLLGDDADGIGSAPSVVLRDPSPVESDVATIGSNGPDRSMIASPPSFVRTPSNLSVASTVPSPRTASASFSSLQRTPSMTHSRSNSLKPEPPKEKFKPVKRDSPVMQRQPSSSSAVSLQASPSSATRVGAAESSDEDEGPEDAAGQRYGSKSGQATPMEQSTIEESLAVPIDGPVTAIAGRQTSADFDSKPGAAAVEKIAPNGNGRQAPPLLAPKPTKPGLSSLVSQYETLSAGPSPTLTNDRAKEKPVKPPKPGTSLLSNSSSSDDFSARFPVLDTPVQKSGPQSSKASPTNREPFKPSRENSVTNLAAAAEGRARPQSMHFPTPPPSTSSKLVRAESLVKPKQESGEQQEEEKFQGVASLRDRWNKMGQQQQQANSGSPLERRKSTLGNASSKWR